MPISSKGHEYSVEHSRYYDLAILEASDPATVAAISSIDDSEANCSCFVPTKYLQLTGLLPSKVVPSAFQRYARPRGGSTVVTLKIGEDVYVGQSECCLTDNFDRKRSVAIALGRAYKAKKLADQANSEAKSEAVSEQQTIPYSLQLSR